MPKYIMVDLNTGDSGEILEAKSDNHAMKKALHALGCALCKCKGD